MFITGLLKRFPMKIHYKNEINIKRFEGGLTIPTEIANNSKLTPNEKYVMSVLIRIGMEGESSPSNHKLEKYTGLNMRGIATTLANLEKKGYLTRNLGNTKHHRDIKLKN